MFVKKSTQSVNWGSWFSVVKLPMVAFPVSYCRDGLIRSIYIHGIVVREADWPASGLWFGGVFSPDY